MMKKAKSGRKKRPGIRLSSFWELAGSALRISRPLPFHSHTTCCPSPCLGYYPQQLATMATPSPRGRVDSGRGTIAGPFPSVPLRTVRDRFRVTRLSGGGLAPVQSSHITCASPYKTIHLDCFALCVAFPRSPVGHHSHDYYQSSVAIFLAEGRPSRVSSRCYVQASDVRHPLISLLDLIGHRPRWRGCIGREAFPLHIVASLSDVAAVGTSRPDWRLGFRQSSFTLIVRVLRRVHLHVFGEPPRSRHAFVPLGFPRQVSR
jgi:hypothetical protein